MNEAIFAIITAFWLGILTSISPCPLATNIAAISFVGRRLNSILWVFTAGILYTFGRTLVYTLLGVLLVKGVLAAPELSYVLQKYMNLIMGPLLILVAMVLLRLLSLPAASGYAGEKLRRRVEKLGVLGAGLLGIVFALSFCPVSAALFFGSLLPLAIKFESGFLLPLVYGTATGLPVLFFAFMLAFAAGKIGKVYSKITIFEKWAQKITGIIFMLIGIYFTLTIVWRI